MELRRNTIYNAVYEAGPAVYTAEKQLKWFHLDRLLQNKENWTLKTALFRATQSFKKNLTIVDIKKTQNQ